MTKNFLDQIKGSFDDPYASIVSEGIVGDEGTYNIDMGNYALNALLTGSIFKGLRSNKRLMLAGETSTGKTFYALEAVYHFLEDNEDAYVVYFDTESALDDSIFDSRGIDKTRVLLSQPTSIESFRTYAKQILTSYKKTDASERPKMLFVLDSMGMLSSEAEIGNVEKGNNVADMKKSQLWKGAFRVLALELSVLNVPMIIVNHVYAKIGSFIPGVEIGGGQGGKLAADTIVTLTKAKEKNGALQVGAIISCTAWKSRATREGTKVKTRLLFEKGLDRYSGLLELAEAAEVFVKSGNRYIVDDKDTKAYKTAIEREPEKFYTQQVLEKIDKWTRENFTLSGTDRALAFQQMMEEEDQ